LERFYEQMAAKARLPTHPLVNGVNANWLLSMARSYRRLSKDKRSRGRLRAMMRPGPQGDLSELPATGGSGLLEANASLRTALPLQRPITVVEQPGWSSTDDSGYEAGYETDADESELSEWEGGPSRHGHKRKLDALVQLTMRLSVVERDEAEEAAALADSLAQLPPLKMTRALGTRPVGLRFSLPHATDPPELLVASASAPSAVASAIAPIGVIASAVPSGPLVLAQSGRVARPMPIPSSCMAAPIASSPAAPGLTLSGVAPMTGVLEERLGPAGDDDPANATLGFASDVAPMMDVQVERLEHARDYSAANGGADGICTDMIP